MYHIQTATTGAVFAPLSPYGATTRSAVDFKVRLRLWIAKAAYLS
jgi:hypothetical protein